MPKINLLLHLFVLSIILLRAQCVSRPRVTLPGAEDSVRGRSGRRNLEELLGRTLAATATQCSIQFPKCPSILQQQFPTVDGKCNNRVDGRTGTPHQSFKRILPAHYHNGRDSLRRARNGQTLPSARVISNAIQQGLNTTTQHTHMLPFWGQFLVHDIALTLEPEAAVVPCNCFQSTNSECINIPIPEGDVQYRTDPRRIKVCFTMQRAAGGPDTADCSNRVRQQMNEISAFLDMGLIYGNTEAQITALRDHSAERAGELIAVNKDTNRNNFGHLLPQSDYSEAIKPAADFIFCPQFVRKPIRGKCRVSGEARTNENSVLQSHHTVWMRLHNVVVLELRRVNPNWSSDMLFQNGKLIVTSLHQRITFQHFLPAILGNNVMQRYGLKLLTQGFWYGYDSSYDASVTNSFTTAAFRMGHTLINQWMTRPNPSWTGKQASDIRVKTSLFNLRAVNESRGGGPNSFIRGLANDSAITFDPTFSDDLRNFLFSPNFNPSAFGNDLLATNIQRGRDHGLPSYTKFREFCGLSVPGNFNDLSDTMSNVAITNLKKAYSHVADIDLYAGGVSERSEEGGTVGPTFACIIAYQFRDLKNGDRFWHENAPPIGPFNRDQLAALRAIPFGRLLCEMVDDMQSVQEFPMQKVSSRNPRKRCNEYPPLNLDAFREGYSSNANNQLQNTVGTTWFPTVYNGQRLTIAELHRYLLIARPGQVCRQVLRSKTRSVNGHTQVRFRCLPGTISHSDFPPVPSHKYQWTRWYISAARNARDSIISKPPLRCTLATAIQAQTLNGVPARETKDVFTQFSPSAGFVCLGNQQKSGRCDSYRVRFLCFRA